jgi:alpha-beta hydrolase superfamily lysophospholipase/ubiquinone/menaquinone biosynthesis C-methylase UbiE
MSVIAAKRQGTENSLTIWDGTKLFYRAWLPPLRANKALILFHRGHEHSGRFQELVDAMDLEDVAVFAWDARGHGRSPGERGYAESFSGLIKDADSFIRFLASEYQIPMENMIVLGHSVGAVLVAAWVHDYAPPIRAMILATPAFRVKLYIPFAIPGLRVLQATKGKAFMKSYVKARMLTHDPEQAQKYQSDPLISRNIAVNILIDLEDTSRRLLADAGAVRVPTLLLAAGSDWVVRVSAQKKFFERLSSINKEMVVYPGFYHAIFQEKERHLPIAKVREFISQILDRVSPQPTLLDADKAGYTKQEYDRLRQPLPIWSPRHWGFQINRLVLKTFGRLSKGIQIGWRTGFDSGESLDYIYANRAQGFTPLGKIIDRMYLNAIGWIGIRQRKINLERILQSTIEKVHAEGRPVRVLDIASGPGRYLLDTLKKIRGIPASALLRDHNLQGLEAGRKLAQEMGLSNVTYQAGDAFDSESLAAASPKPTIAIVSGLYELFPDNDRVMTSLRGLARAIEPAGYLIYTNQPWHPQVEFIARVLINRDGNPWIMRRRTQAEMDDLVRAAGFEKLDMEIDNYGIFTVSLAKKAGNGQSV